MCGAWLLPDPDRVTGPYQSPGDEPVYLHDVLQRPPRKRIGIWQVLAIFCAAIVITIGVLAVLTRRGPTEPAAAASGAPSPTTAGPSPTATVAPPATNTTPPRTTVGPWAPCDPQKDGYDGGCERFFHADSCDASHYSNTAGSLLDAYIENRSSVNAERLKDCPQFLSIWQKSLTGFTDGTHTVPGEVKPGTYETTAHLTGGKVTDCYWERRQGGKTAANDFVLGATKVRITVRQGDDDVVSRGCGNWVRV